VVSLNLAHPVYIRVRLYFRLF